MPKILKEIQQAIITSSIEQDQDRVAQQWLNTFKYNREDCHATNMAKILLACVARGDFQVASKSVEDPSLQAPSDSLSITDYISHASRIVIDYDRLSDQHKLELLKFFPEPAEDNGVVARSATHAVLRQEDGVKELKGFMLGVKGQLPSFVKTPNDFGINIAMGGQGRENFIGNRISNNGYSGHMYFHHYSPDSLLMVGLEQSAPAGSILEAIWGHQDTEDDDVQKHHDQYGQGHSLVGASDTFTSAGSLYFSDPLYQAKLLTEKGIMPPDKYGAMQVKLTDENWPNIKTFFEDLNANLGQNNDEALRLQLLDSPQASQKNQNKVISYISLDFKTYLKRIELLLDFTLNFKDQSAIFAFKTKTSTLLTLIEQLQSGESSALAAFSNAIHELTKDEELPQTYRDAITRIKALFTLQLEVDPNLTKTNSQILFQHKAETLTEEVTRLRDNAQLLLQFYSSEYINPDQHIMDYKEKIERSLEIFDEINERLLTNSKILESDFSDLTKSFNGESSLLSSWLELGDQLELSDLDAFQDKLETINQTFTHPPILYSKDALSNEIKKLTEQAAFAQQQSETEIAALNAQLLKLSGNTQQKDSAIVGLQAKVAQVEKQAAFAQQQSEMEIAALNTRLLELAQNSQQKDSAIVGLQAKVAQVEKQAAFAQQQSEIEIAALNTRLLESAQNSQQKDTQMVKLQDKIKELEQQLAQGKNTPINLAENTTTSLPVEQPTTDDLVKLEQVKNQKLELKQKIIAPVHDYLAMIRDRTSKLTTDRHRTAANSLLSNIEDEITNYLRHDDADIVCFKDNCKAHIDEAKVVLSEANGWDVLLNNLLICVCTLVVPYIVAGLANLAITGSFLFFNNKTPMRDKLNEIESSIQNINETSFQNLVK